ncbi:uncharacterized protein LOC143580506 [Bidens hawaiensis]|uniref:uncharacterized protein LOC143580506 n=1 Tax=Bidens hawaiensis TaxID=980011 RepID=UPI00404AEBAB
MAEKKSSGLGFRFRLPWFPQASLPPARQSPTQPPRTTTQTSVASTSAQKPPFRPAGKALAPPPAAPPTTAATPQPFSPRRSQPSVSTKSSVPKSPTAKTTAPVATKPAKETQPTTETATPQTPPSPSSSSSSSSSPSTSSSSSSSSPKSPTAKTTKFVAAQPPEETETIQTSTAIHTDISSFIHKITKKEPADETPAHAITLAGNNTGALMQLDLHELKRGDNRTTDDNAIASSQKDNEKHTEAALPKAIVNSNIQGVNNSMMLNSSVTEGSPGVHLVFYGDVTNIEGLMMKSVDMQRAEVNVTAPEKVVYDPVMGEVFM